MRFKAFTAVKVQVEDFWVVMPCNVAVGYQCSLTLKMKAAWISEMYPTALLCGVTTLK
jgi:hypothetical protein